MDTQAVSVKIEQTTPCAVKDNDRHFSTTHLLKDLKGRTISSGVVTTLSQGTQFGLLLVSTVVLARMLQPRDFGLVAMVITVLSFLKIFNDAGLSTATIQREAITHAQVSNLFWINVGLSGAISLIVAVSAPLIAWFYHERRLIPITLALSVSFLLEGSTVQHMALLSRQMRFKMIAVIQISAALAGVVAGIGMAWLKCGYWSLVGAQLAVPVVSFMLTWSASRWRPQLPARGSGVRPMVSFGANLTASNFIATLARGTDSLLIGRVYGADAVGLYSRASALLQRPVQNALTPLNAVFVPVLSRLQSEPERYRRIFLQVYEGMALCSFLFTGIFLALARPLTLVILGQKWEKAAVIFAAFAMAAIFYPLYSTANWLFTSQGRGGDCLRTNGLTAAATVCSFAVGLPFGPAGVAFAYSASGLLLVLPIVYYKAGRQGPVNTTDLWMGFLRQLPVWAVVCGGAYAARMLVTNSRPAAQLLVCAPLGMLAGAIFIFLFPPSRRVALGMLDVLKTMKKGRGKAQP
jgi:PST family polysaccharide transporter